MNMNYVYDAAPGELYDFFNSIIIGYNYDVKDLYQSYKADLDIDPDMIAQDAFERIWEDVNRSMPGLGSLLSYFRDKESFLDWTFDRKIAAYADINEFIEAFRNIPKEELSLSLLQYYDEENRGKEFFDGLLADSGKLFAFIDSINTSEMIKWELLKIINKPEPIIKEVLAFFTLASKRLDEVYDKNIYQLKQFETYMNDRIAAQKDTFFLFDDCPGLEEKINIVKFKTVKITAAIMSRNIIFTRDCGAEFRVYLSLNYKELIDRQCANDGWYNLRLMLRALSDETRHGMYKLLMGKEMYLTEIAEALDASISTTVHHLDIMSKASVIISFDKGKKRFYTVNTKQMDQYVKMFSDYYKK
jgi:DNA-binding transcriptional ArsR family regulator